ncbi:MAG: YraN family protein [bacterium]|nr:YraN family protein [bacterium]
MPNAKRLTPKVRFGNGGEVRAADFLIQAGYEIKAKNFRYKNDEVDLVVWDKRFQELVFVEVKTRARAIWGDPSLAVNARKLVALERAARAYIQQFSVTSDYRFDIVAICDDSVEHFENISWLFRN